MPDPIPALEDPLATLLAGLPGVVPDPAVAAVLSAVRSGALLGHTGCELAAVAAAIGVPVDALHARLIASGLAQVATAGSAPSAPLVIDGGRVADRRTWMHEQALAQLLVARARAAGDLVRGQPGVAADIARVLAVDPARQAVSVGGVHWQRLAACTALSRGLTLVSGGPGTGKTTVAAVVVGLVALARARRGEDPPQVVLAAPTAKAAQRLAEAVRHELAARALADPAAIAQLAGWTSTLHRLFHDARVASADLAVIDEVSMADVATLRRALERLPPTCRLLLLGDPDQLASVEPGRVLSDLVAHHSGRTPPDIAAANASAGGADEPLVAAADQHPLADVQVRLGVNWRSGDAPPLARLVQALQRAGGDAVALALLDDRANAPAAGLRGGRDGHEPVWAVRAEPPATPAALISALWSEHGAWATALASAPDALGALARFDAVRLLSTLRQGDWGSDRLNPLWEARLMGAAGIMPDEHGHYHGRPLLVQRNRPDLGLDNGSIGVVWREDGRLVGRFPAVGGTIAVPLHRLDAWTPAWVLTVHKAQGSQGATVEVIGPGPQASPAQRRLATRELVYTGITRARLRCRVWWDRGGLAEALARRSERAGGFAQQLLRAAEA